MAGRKPDPTSRYRVVPHKANGYMYAATCETVTLDSGKRSRRYTHWGALAEGNRFVPNLRFLTLPAEERQRLTFPAGWDLSAIETPADAEAEVGSELAEPTEHESKLYGNVWLMLKISERLGVTQDLMTVFCHQAEVVNDILTIAVFPYLTKESLSHIPDWQRSLKLPSAHALTPSRVTRLTQSITHDQVMEFFRLRIDRQPAGAYYACDSTTRTAWGGRIAEIRYGRNKDNKELDCTLEVVVYSLTTHEPVYYRTFPGNMPDARTVRTIVQDLKELGVEDLYIVYDRGYESADNIGEFVAMKMPFLICAKVAQAPVVKSIEAIGWDEDGFPKGMDYDEAEGIFHAQFPLGPMTVDTPDRGTVEIKKGDVVCNAYLDMAKRVEKITELRLDIQGEREALEAMSAEEALAKRSRINKGLRYHRASFSKAKGEWSYDGFAEASDKVRRAKATCGFYSSVAYGMPGGALDHLRVYRSRDEQEKYFEQMKDQMGFKTQDCSTEASKEGRLFILFVGLILTSAARATWRRSPEMRREFGSTRLMVNHMRDIRWCGYPDGETHMTSFTDSQARVCEAFGIEVPRECLSTQERKKADSKRRRETSATLGRGNRPAQNKVSA